VERRGEKRSRRGDGTRAEAAAPWHQEMDHWRRQLCVRTRKKWRGRAAEVGGELAAADHLWQFSRLPHVQRRKWKQSTERESWS
jgi:hypothetical protein